MKGRWIITGGNGYLGGELCKGLARQEENVLAVARPGRQLNGLIDAGIPCHSYENLAVALSPGDVFVHCAGKTGSGNSWEEFFRINVEWTSRLFDLAVQKEAACFVYVSSVAALGYGNRPAAEPLDESAEPRLAPGELYGRSKLRAEQTLQQRARGKSIRLVILRPGLIYGHRPLARKQTWLRRGLLVDPCQRVPLVHVDNFVEAVFRAVTTTKTDGIYFVVDDEQPALSELTRKKIQLGLMHYQPWRIGKTGFWGINVLRMAVRAARGRCRLPPKGYSRARFRFQTRRLLYSTEKLRSHAGWNPRIRLDKGLATCTAKNRPQGQ